LDIGYYREKVPKKYFCNEEHLDKAFCRMMFEETKIGLFPLTGCMVGADVPDSFVRIPINRNYEDLKYLDNMSDVLKKIM